MSNYNEDHYKTFRGKNTVEYEFRKYWDITHLMHLKANNFAIVHKQIFDEW